MLSTAALAGLALAAAITAALPGAGARAPIVLGGPVGGRRERARIRAGAVAATDLLAACLAAGASPAEAVEAVAGVLDGPVADRLAAAAASVRAGGSAEGCWLGLAVVPELAGVGRILARVSVSGARASNAMSAEASRLRLRCRADADRALARVGVWAVAPLGLCFLPAFVCLGIVPVAIGLGRGLAG
jgi:pilus assembly protein TadC